LIEKVSARLKIKTSRIEYFTAKSLAQRPETTADAEEILNKLIKEFPDNFDYQYEKGLLFFMQEDYEKAEPFLIESLKLGHPEKFKIYLHLGKCYQKRELWGNAKACFTRACEVDPKSPISWLGLGIACMKRKDFKDSEIALT